MTVLCDTEIQQALEEDRLTINPAPEVEQYDPTSVDLTLGDEFLRWTTEELASTYGRPPVIEVGLYDWENLAEDRLERVPLNQDGCVVLDPGDFLLGKTAERVGFSYELAGRVEGKSSLARLGLAVHFAPTLHAGWRGRITLELHNVGRSRLGLNPGARICQLIVEPVQGTPTQSMEESRFQDQDSPRGSS